MMFRHLRLLLSAAVATLLLGLAGCGDEPSPPQSTSTASQAPSGDGGRVNVEPSDGGAELPPSENDNDDSKEDPAASAPDVPMPNPDDYPNRDQRTPDGAEQTVRYYFALVFWGYETGDPAPVEALQSPACETCRAFPGQIREISQDGDFWQDVNIEDIGIETYEATNFEHEIGYVFTLSAGVGGYDGRDPDGTDYVAAVGINWVDGEWQIGGLSFEAV